MHFDNNTVCLWYAFTDPELHQKGEGMKESQIKDETERKKTEKQAKNEAKKKKSQFTITVEKRDRDRTEMRTWTLNFTL